MDAAVGELDVAPVETCDGEAMPAVKARRFARLYYYVGFACLPWFWACNIWLFFPDFWHGHDAMIAKYTRRSALWLVVYTCLFLPWMLLYLIDGEEVLGQSAYNALNINRLDLSSAGLGGG